MNQETSYSRHQCCLTQQKLQWVETFYDYILVTPTKESRFGFKITIESLGNVRNQGKRIRTTERK